MPKIAKEISALQLRGLGQGNHVLGGVPGLMLSVRDNSRVFVLRAVVGGKRRTIGIGPAHTLTLGQARDRARALRVQMLDGIDPVEQRRKARAEKVLAKFRETTFAQAARDYIAANAAGWKNDKHAAQWTATLETWAFPRIGQLAVADLTTAHVIEVLKQSVGDEGPFWTARAETASRVRQRMETVIAAADAAAGRERLNPARMEVVGQVLPKSAKVKRIEHHAAMPFSELPAFVAKLVDREGVAARALQWTILTAARSGEVRGMTWAEIDLEKRLWRIPGARMKAGRDHTVPLTDAAIACLPPAGSPDEIVFAGLRGKQMSDATMAAVLDRMGVVNATVHGFRSSFRDWAGESTHHPREVIEAALAHQLGDKAEVAYARGDLRAKREALAQDWAAFVMSKIGLAANVVPLGGRAA